MSLRTTHQLESLAKLSADNEGLCTCLGNLYPYVVLVECIFVCVEASEPSIPFIHLPLAIHRRILLMSKYNPITRLAFSRALSTLTAGRLCFVAFELSLPARLAG
jgi:hypothetical protein